MLLIVGGGIAAYKTLELIRLLRRAGVLVRTVLTASGAQFVTPLTLGALSEDRVYTELFDLTDEHEMGHIELSRQADLVVVAPATANLMARAAAGMADDLATTVLLATDKPVLMAPAMNVRMWGHPATVRNVERLKADGVAFVDPAEGAMACGEWGPGRLAEPPVIFEAIMARLQAGPKPLAGARALVTAGPTFEPLDPVRGLTNRSSGKQGFAVAEALARAGAEVTLVAGPVALPTPPGVRRVDVETALQMRDACAAEAERGLKVAVCVAAVADWRPETVAPGKLKKTADGVPAFRLVPNPDVLAELAAPGPRRPAVVVGFAAETDDLEAHARAKLARKGCDLIVANDVREGVFGTDRNQALLVSREGAVAWPAGTKAELAERLVAAVAERLK